STAAKLEAALSLLSNEERRTIEPLVQQMAIVFGYLDSPRHTRIQRLVAHAFQSDLISNLRPSFDHNALELLCLVRYRGTMEVMSESARPRSAQVALRSFGFPSADAVVWRRWSADILRISGPAWSAEDIRTAVRAVSDAAEYVRNALSSHASGLLTALLEARNGEERLSPSEVIAVCIQLVAATCEGLPHAIGN